MVICSSNKSKKNELEHPPKVIWPNLRGAPMLNNIQTNRRHQTRLKRKQARDDENFIESLTKYRILTQFEKRNTAFEQQLQRSLSRESASGFSRSPAVR